MVHVGLVARRQKKKREKHNQNSMKYHDINLYCVQSAAAAAAVVAGQFPSTIAPVHVWVVAEQVDAY